ncbi:hypothetical protein [Streptomyces lunaelactis]|nr:hypothetical protein [Streptomyces lunaelactis]
MARRGKQQLQGLLYDTERVYGPYHQPPGRRRAPDRQRQFHGG